MQRSFVETREFLLQLHLCCELGTVLDFSWLGPGNSWGRQVKRCSCALEAKIFVKINSWEVWELF